MDTSRPSPLALTVLALLHHKPLHPYGMQQLIKRWGKDQVVNVGQRASLHRTIERLRADGLIAIRETARDRAYPERTIYEITEAGRRTARDWLDQMIANPRQEYPQFPAAVSHLLMVSPQQARDALHRRAERIADQRAALQAALTSQAGHLDRVATLESEYLLATTTAEEHWLRGVVEDLDTGRLTWLTPVVDPAE